MIRLSFTSIGTYSMTLLLYVQVDRIHIHHASQINEVMHVES